MPEQVMSAAERAEFIERIDRALPGGVVERLASDATQRFGDRQPEFVDRLNAARPGQRLEAVADAIVENAAQRATANGMQYVPDEVGRSAEVEFTSLEMARSLRQAAELGPDVETRDARYFADRALTAGDIATIGIQIHDFRGGLDSSGQLPGPQLPEPSDPAPDWLQDRVERLAQEYGGVLADHRDRHSGLLEARRISGIDVVRSPSEAQTAQSTSSDSARSAARAGETRRTSPERG
ncbi:hypothetical protein [Kribbella soli]|uniref:Uncharacterized protein n=1 Tax=Kribbella soli TaxID=1124743 RepID=A0A4R0HIB6_9ACTN|nr:hypothetical protein [Kribbella soli]TCC11075.1 hypothetical protein E0H45_07235 [Kribbella soli]